jgi:carotenoid cleavage dioxygenase
MAKFPETFNFQGWNAPIRAEFDVEDIEVEGQIPSDLDGAFYRVQPDPHYPPKASDDIWFNGDGMVSMFRFKNGKAHLKHRYVRTDKFKLESKVGKALFGAYRNPLTDDPSVKGQIRGTANTNVVLHAGKLFALKEDSPAIEMNALTLETVGNTKFSGKMESQTFTAHPKVDPVTGDMIGFGYAAKGFLGRDIALHIIGKDGVLKREMFFELPYYCMMHDFGLTQDYAVFHVVPIISSWERLEKGLPHFGFDTTMPIYLGIVPREGDAKDVRWFTAPNCFASHVWNAFNEGAKVHIDVPMSKNNMFPFFPDVHGAPFNPQEAEGRMTRWTVDMNSNSDKFDSMEQLCDFVGEFPRIDDRYASLPYRHGWQLVIDASKPCDLPGVPRGAFMNSIGHVDLATGKKDSWWAGPVCSVQEPCFIPKSANAPEGEGYIIAVINRVLEMRSEFVILDAQNLSAGPLATLKLPVRLRNGLHGNWYPADHLPAQKAA